MHYKIISELGRKQGKAKGAGSEDRSVNMAELIARLKDQSSTVRYTALRELCNIGDEALEAVPDVLPLLKDPDIQVNMTAITVLEKAVIISQNKVNLGSDQASNIAKLVLPKLCECLKAERIRVREQASASLAKIGAVAIPVLCVLAKNSSTEVRKLAALALGEMAKEAMVVVPVLIRLLDDPEADVQEAAAMALGRIGPEAEPALNKLFKLTCSTDILVRKAAADALVNLGESGIEVLCERLENACIFAFEGLDVYSTIGFSLREARLKTLPVVSKLMLDPENDFREATNALWFIGGKDAMAVLTRLLHATKNRDERLEILGNLRPPYGGGYNLIDKGSVEGLIELLADKDPLIRTCVARLLGRIGPTARAAVRTLRSLLKDQQGEVRSAAKEALAKIEVKNDDKQKLKTFLEAYSGKDHPKPIREAVQHILDTVSTAKDLIPALHEQFKSPVYLADHIAAIAIGKLGKEGLKYLHKLEEDPMGDIEACCLANWALNIIGEEVDFQHMIMHDEDREKRFFAIFAVMFWGPDAKEFIPDLRILLKDPSEKVRLIAKAALEHIIAYPE
ncbi:MAG: HEAT repeat domain-containing protein [Candidatus Margulisiibacteriota bacterium]|jgi:HEAT repeat protein